MVRSARGFQPDWIVPPGATLGEWLEETSMSQAELAERLSMSPKAVNQIVRGHAPISHTTALKLESVTNVPARLWNQLETNYQEDVARLTRLAQFSTESAWLEELPIAALRKQGVVSATLREKGTLVSQLLTFFGVADVHAWRSVWEAPQAAYRKSPTLESRSGDLAAWLRCGELAGARIVTSPYSGALLDAALVQIRELVREPIEAVWPQMQEHAARAGVVLVAVPTVGKTRASGATRWVGGRPIVQLSGRHKTDDHIWFSLFHEFGHVRLHSPRDTFVDNGGVDDDLEREADAFASEILIPSEWLQRLACVPISKTAVTTLANEMGISPGVLAGRLQHDGRVPRTHLNKLKRTVQVADLAQ